MVEVSVEGLIFFGYVGEVQENCNMIYEKKIAWYLCCLRLEICYDWVPSRLFWDTNSSKSSTLRHRLHRNLQEVPTWGWLKSFAAVFGRKRHGNAFSRQKSACSFFLVSKKHKKTFLEPFPSCETARNHKKKHTHPTGVFTQHTPKNEGHDFTRLPQPCLVEATYPKFRVIPGREAAKAVTWALWGPKYSKASFFAAMR